MAVDRHADTLGATRSVLALTATLMETAFEELGEGVILGTMPAYMEQFGADNARFLAKRYVNCDASVGAVSALTPMNHVSRVTGTPFTMPKARKDEAVKRLNTCEFLEAFEGRGDFPRAMMCQLHQASYQGSVNGLLEDPAQGYDVQVRSRILFGDPHCDFAVVSRKERPTEEDAECEVNHDPSPEDVVNLQFHFYTYMLGSFVDYLTTMLPAERLLPILRDEAQKVGTKIHHVLDATRELPKDAPGVAVEMLRAGGRSVEAEGGTLTVSSCPQAQAIREATRGHTVEEDGVRARTNMCGLCHGALEGVVKAACPNATVKLDGAMTLGAPVCTFRVEDA